MSNSRAPANLGKNDPLFGWLPRNVTSEQVLKAMVRPLSSRLTAPCIPLTPICVCAQEGDVNPFTKRPHSAQYKKILEARKKLPVFGQMDDFLKIVSRSFGFTSSVRRERIEGCAC